MSCSHCDNELVSRQASVPETILGYRAGVPDPDVIGNRLVMDSVCPIHGVVYSPGGGVCAVVTLRGGPWDGRKPIWSCHEEEIVIVKDVEHVYKRDVVLNDFIYNYVGVKS